MRAGSREWLHRLGMATGSVWTGSDDIAEELLLEEGTGTETGDVELGAATLTGEGDDVDGKPGRKVLKAARSGAALLPLFTKSRRRKLN
ncbi:unnamed protein product [Linum trigynum]|uniref:Uncharacterized protein n=1 Tax=Linum trigynum TaxID=586398 RepID=A0AAV2EDV6_9ROSI